jgi:serine/threonine protein kinase
MNVLVDNSERARITDFGLSMFRPNNTSGLTLTTDSGGRTDRWASPELLEENAVPTRASDIWAFGCVCYEVRHLVTVLIVLILSDLYVDLDSSTTIQRLLKRYTGPPKP